MASYLQRQQTKYVFIQVCILPQSESIRGEWTNGNRFWIIILYLHLYLYVLLMEEPFFSSTELLAFMNESFRATYTTAYTTKMAWPICQKKKQDLEDWIWKSPAAVPRPFSFHCATNTGFVKNAPSHKINLFYLAAVVHWVYLEGNQSEGDFLFVLSVFVLCCSY